jgi:hypothetical protein
MAPPGAAGTRETGPSQVPAVNDARNIRRQRKAGYTTIRKHGAFSTMSTAHAIPPNRRVPRA